MIEFMWKSPYFWFPITLVAILLLAAVSPEERSLGANVRLVYLHGAWVWAALALFLAAGLTGLAGLVRRRTFWGSWSLALGRAGLIFWIVYLPLSLLTMQANWNGLFLVEPRWRLAAVFALGGLALQIGLTIVNEPLWISAGNFFYAVALFWSLARTEQVMHPASPIFNSEATTIQLFFVGLVLLTLLAAWQVTRWLYRFEVN
jgi:hypothetical protein